MSQHNADRGKRFSRNGLGTIAALSREPLRQDVHAPERRLRRNRREADPDVRGERPEARTGRQEETFVRTVLEKAQKTASVEGSRGVHEEERSPLRAPGRRAGARPPFPWLRTRRAPHRPRRRPRPRGSGAPRAARPSARCRSCGPRASRSPRARLRARQASRSARPRGRTPSTGNARRPSARARARALRRALSRTHSPRRPRPRISTRRAARPSPRARRASRVESGGPWGCWAC